MIDGKIIQDINAEAVIRTNKNDLDDLGDAVQGLQAKLPDAPTTEGTYKLTCTVTSSATTYSWVSAA